MTAGAKLFGSVTRRIITTLLIVFLTAFAAAQDRLNSLAVDGVLADEAGPYYFTAWGESSTPFAQASPLARALGLRLDWNGDTRTLTFTDGDTTLTPARNADTRTAHQPPARHPQGNA